MRKDVDGVRPAVVRRGEALGCEAALQPLRGAYERKPPALLGDGYLAGSDNGIF